MITRIATVLLCTVAPVALFAQEVDLRSSDEFISVEGEIIGFNGVMVRVQTSVGAVSVPASEVICYGPACLQVIASNDFGLTADAFQSVVVEAEPTLQALSDDLAVSFDAPIFATLYRTVAGAFSVANDTATSVIQEPSGEIALESGDGTQTANLTLAADGAIGDINIRSVSLNGTAPATYTGPAGWALGEGLTHQLVGLQSFSVVIAPNADMAAISINDIARIYAGEITNWSQIGGADVNILPLQMPENSLIGTEVMRLVMEPAGKEIAGNVLTMADEAGILASINQFPGSISIVNSIGATENLTVPVSGSCGMPVAPTTFNIVSGDYPFARPVMATYAQAPNTGLVTELLDFASADVAQTLIAREGFISHNAITLDPTLKNARLTGLLAAPLDDAQRAAAAEMFQVLFDADRLSPTLIGGATSGPEGGWNRAMFVDLLDVLADPNNAGRELVFVGLGESTAGSAAAIDASVAAAAEMQSVFRQFAAEAVADSGVSLTSYGFGNVSPVACIDGQVAGSEYTRVEVWIR